MDSGTMERLGFAHDVVRSRVVRNPDQRRHLDLREIASDLIAVAPQDADLVPDRFDIADDVASIGVGSHKPQRLSFPTAPDETRGRGELTGCGEQSVSANR